MWDLPSEKCIREQTNSHIPRYFMTRINQEYIFFSCFGEENLFSSFVIKKKIRSKFSYFFYLINDHHNSLHFHTLEWIPCNISIQQNFLCISYFKFGSSKNFALEVNLLRCNNAGFYFFPCYPMSLGRTYVSGHVLSGIFATTEASHYFPFLIFLPSLRFLFIRQSRFDSSLHRGYGTIIFSITYTYNY